MKLLGFLLVTVGFIMAALATVVDQSALKALDESAVEAVDETAAEAPEESPVQWAWYIPAPTIATRPSSPRACTTLGCRGARQESGAPRRRPAVTLSSRGPPVAGNGRGRFYYI